MSNEQDFSQRIVIVVRRDIEAWQQANVIAHIAAFLGNSIGNEFATGAYFSTRDGVQYPRNCQYPIIIKTTDSSARLHTLLQNAQSERVHLFGFIREMILYGSDEALQHALQEKNADDVEYLGAGVLGENESANKLTKKFGLLR